jgi:hypothetical protein
MLNTVIIIVKYVNQIWPTPKLFQLAAKICILYNINLCYQESKSSQADFKKDANKSDSQTFEQLLQMVDNDAEDTSESKTDEAS